MSDVSHVNQNGELFDKDGNLVKLKPTKAVFGGVIGFLSLTATGLSATVPEDSTTAGVLTVISIVVGAAATVLGIYIPANKIARHRA